MSADGYINDPHKPIHFRIKCYQCGGRINPKNPAEGHEECIDGFTGALKYVIDAENMDE